MSEDQKPRIIVTTNGPYVVTGNVPLSVQTIVADPGGGSDEWVEGEAFEVKDSYALCRCGKSGNAPFCDGTHAKVGFDGTETATRQPYDEQKKVFEGPDFVLEDVRAFCAAARFCDAQGSTWDSIAETGDPAIRERVMQQVSHCPSGRLVLRDKSSGAVLEPDLPLSIGVVEDPSEGCSGPLWVRGGIQIESLGGETYEARNRVTLCRCGQSRNKPFCDGSHITVKYQDGRS
jgi:CDGSH-type Zn-finger protein